jgi:anti-sigma regulatory factor (Ser/Thr protein kinase)
MSLRLAISRGAAEILESHREAIANRVSARCFSELESYKSGEMQRDESVQTVTRLLNFLIDALSSAHDDSGEASSQGSSIHDDIVVFEQGIAARRVKMSIQFEDLIRGLQIMRIEVWNALAQGVASPDFQMQLDELEDRHIKHNNGPDTHPSLKSQAVFMMEKRVNAIFDAFFLGLSSSYRQNQSSLMKEQENALEKWEEVVKSASHIHLKIPCSEEFIKIVRLQAEAIARRVEFSEDAIFDIITAVGEACDNCIEHGVSDQGIDVQYNLTPTEFRVEVQDYGPGFDPDGMGEVPPDLLDEDGRGLFLMKQLMDFVSIESKVGVGTKIVVAKSRKPIPKV